MMAAVLLIAVTACKKEGPEFFRGRYGYSVSGTIKCECTTLEGDTEQRTFAVADEQGVMHIEPHGSQMVMTTKDIGGGVTVFDATVSGTEISTKPLAKRIKVRSGGILSAEEIDVTVECSGYKSNGLIVMEMKISAPDFMDGVIACKITGSDVKCVATAQ